MKLHKTFHFIRLNSGSIGHFVQDTELVLHNIKSIFETQSNFKPIFILERKICNSYFEHMLYSLNLLFVPWFPSYLLHRVLRKFSRKYRMRDNIILDKDRQKLAQVYATSSIYYLPDSDIRRGYELVEKLGITSLSKVVYLVIRDRGYDDFMKDNSFDSKQSWRQTPVAFFLPMVERLIERGFTVVRIGRHNVEKLRINSDKYVDITSSPKIDADFLDFFLSYICQFAVSTGSGMDTLPQLFRKPTLFLNVAGLYSFPKTKLCNTVLVSDYLNLRTGTKLSFEELMSNNWHLVHPPTLLERNAIKVIPKSSEAIVYALDLFLSRNFDTNMDLSAKLLKEFDHFLY